MGRYQKLNHKRNPSCGKSKSQLDVAERNQRLFASAALVSSAKGVCLIFVANTSLLGYHSIKQSRVLPLGNYPSLYYSLKKSQDFVKSCCITSEMQYWLCVHDLRQKSKGIWKKTTLVCMTAADWIIFGWKHLADTMRSSKINISCKSPSQATASCSQVKHSYIIWVLRGVTLTCIV